MAEPKFDPESAEILHKSVFFSGITDRLLSHANAIKEYENLHSALKAIDAPKSEKVIAEFLYLLQPFANEGFDRIDEEVTAHEAQIEELENRYMEADEDVPAMIHQLYEDLAS